MAVQLSRSLVCRSCMGRDRLIESTRKVRALRPPRDRDPFTGRQCPFHGPLVGVRYCPECASDGKPWTEDQADAASVLMAKKEQ